MIPINDDALDQTLARLASVDIPNGLEQRILTALAIHAAATHTARSDAQPRPGSPASIRPRLFTTRKAATLAFSGLAAALALTVVDLRHRAIDSNTQLIHPGLAAQPALSSLHTPPPSTISPSSLGPSINPPRPIAAAHVVSGNPSPDLSEADAALALAETNAPSQLAPSLPLTDDERTLLQLARRSTPEAINSLDAPHRAAQEAADSAAFDAFFTPPAPPTKPSGESE